MEVCISYCMLEKILKNFGSWDMCQNVVGQADYRIFKSTISGKQDDENIWVFTSECQIIEVKSWFKNLEMGGVKNECAHSCCRNQI